MAPHSSTLAWKIPFPSPEDLPNPGIDLGSPVLQADSLPVELSGVDRDLEIVIK